MLGNEAIALGALDSGLNFISCYPGTPSSEVIEYIRQSDGGIIWEYSINEKVALEAACGAALAGKSALATMKHVGLNVAADPLFTSAYIGMPGGLVILSADDPGCHSSQNEQDNRNYARSAHLPCLEPACAAEAYDMTRQAFELAQTLEQPVLLRTTTRINHSRSPVKRGAPAFTQSKDFAPSSIRFVPVPAVARTRHKAMLEQMEKAQQFSESCKFNKCFMPLLGAGKKPCGIIASGVSRNYMRDALSELDLQEPIAIFDLGMIWPLPKKRLAAFLAACKKILVLEEGEPFLETEIGAIAQNLAVPIEGKNENLSELGEFSTTIVKNRIERWLGRQPKFVKRPEPLSSSLPVRPPNLCPGCGHRSAYYAAKQVFGNDYIYSNDIGCYTLGMLPPLSAANFMICMGSSISAGSGYAAASNKPVVAFIGDSTFFHSGISGLANAVYNNRNLILVILDNATTAMTGHQPNPGMHQQVLGETAKHLDMEAIISALGVKYLKIIKAHNLEALRSAFEEVKNIDGVRVIIAREPCLLYARQKLRKFKNRIAMVRNQGEAAEKCAHELACPAFTRENNELAINGDMCNGCMLCVQIAPEAFAPAKRAN